MNVAEEQAKARMLAKAISSVMARVRHEQGLSADATCAACAGAMIEQAQLAGFGGKSIAAWLRDIAAWVETASSEPPPKPKFRVIEGDKREDD